MYPAFDFAINYSSKASKDKMVNLCLMREEPIENTHILDWELSSQVASGNHGAICCIQDVTQMAHTVC